MLYDHKADSQESDDDKHSEIDGLGKEMEEGKWPFLHQQFLRP